MITIRMKWYYISTIIIIMQYYHIAKATSLIYLHFVLQFSTQGITVAQAIQNYIYIHLVLTMIVHEYVQIIKITVSCSLRLLLQFWHSFSLRLHYIHYTKEAIINDITIAKYELLRQRNNGMYHLLKSEDQRTTEEYKTSSCYFLGW